MRTRGCLSGSLLLNGKGFESGGAPFLKQLLERVFYKKYLFHKEPHQRLPISDSAGSFLGKQIQQLKSVFGLHIRVRIAYTGVKKDITNFPDIVLIE